jgi:protein involved in polysaccharide export with SLBB domain
MTRTVGLVHSSNKPRRLQFRRKTNALTSKRALAVTALVALGSVFLFPHAWARAQAPSARAGAPAEARPPVVQLRRGDAVRVEIKDEPTLSGEFNIGVDGKILLPTVGAIPVADLPFPDVEAQLQAAYKKELVDPVVRITPLIRIAVLGEVRQPGLILIDATHAVVDVLAAAGGLAPNANQKRIAIVAHSGEQIGRFNVDAPTVVYLSSGDQLVVPKRSWLAEQSSVLLGAAGSLAVAIVTAVILR